MDGSTCVKMAAVSQAAPILRPKIALITSAAMMQVLTVTVMVMMAVMVTMTMTMMLVVLVMLDVGCW